MAVQRRSLNTRAHKYDHAICGLARILHEAFYCERRKHGIFVLILEVRTRMYFSTIRPQTSRINFALRARTFRTSAALATKYRAICGLGRTLQEASYGKPRTHGIPGLRVREESDRQSSLFSSITSMPWIFQASPSITNVTSAWFLFRR